MTRFRISSVLRIGAIALLLGGFGVSASSCKAGSRNPFRIFFPSRVHDVREPREVANVFTGGALTDAATGQPTETMHGGVEGPEGEQIPELPDILFAFDDDRLTPEAEDVIARAASFLATRPDLGVVLRGHTDERGTEQYNIALGQRRSEAVRQRLIAAGIPHARVQTISYGQFLPASAGTSDGDYARNRRVEFFVFAIE